MTLFLVREDVNIYRDMDAVGHPENNLFESAAPVAERWMAPAMRWSTAGKHRKLPDFAAVEFDGGFAASKAARDFLEDFSSKNWEYLPIEIGQDEFQLVHVLAIDAFPAEHNFLSYETGIGDFVTAVHEAAIANCHLFRELFHGDTPGPSLYASGEFVRRYESSGLTGLDFEPYWPLNERMEFLMQSVREEARKEE